MSANAVWAQRQESGQAGQGVFWGEPRRQALVYPGQVLLIESLKARCQAIRDMLERERFGCGVVQDAREVAPLAERLLLGQHRMPELLICNARMLDDAGLAALVRLSTSRPHLPIIVFSVFSNPRLRASMARLRGACVFDQHFGLGDLRDACLALSTFSRRSL
ncbi:response regulator [Melittangium boletus]|uniref:Response regulatory domain-containing protein n=1 Tax=Melittangium boletus DSM 14713 TaxID=1294270 RepID=A0A286SGA8_9BACT|nr:response regulator [Melittangium boletus]ATB26628.1 hypothetical protein MEBOL_000056 [Melittangium boletus DSM 14713]